VHWEIIVVDPPTLAVIYENAKFRNFLATGNANPQAGSRFPLRGCEMLKALFRHNETAEGFAASIMGPPQIDGCTIMNYVFVCVSAKDQREAL